MVTLSPIPDRLLPLRATIRRKNPSTGAFENVYTDVPCRVARHMDSPNRDMAFTSSEVEISVIFFNRQFSGSDLNIRYEDQIVIDAEVYRVQKATDAASAEHHLEIRAEHLKTMQTDP